MRVLRALIPLVLLTLALPAAVTYLYSQANPASSATSIEQMAASSQTRTFTQYQQTTAAATESTISLLGTVEANQTVALSFLSSGDVADVLVEAGDTVEAGTVLARLSDVAAQDTLADARLALERAQINLDDVLAPASESDLELAQMQITAAQASASTTSTTSDTALAQAQMNVESAQERYDTLVYQRTHSDYSDQEATELDAQIGAASFNLEIARLRLEDVQNPTTDSTSQWSASIRIRQAEIRYEELLAGPTETQVSNAQLSVLQAEQQVAAAELALSRLELIAPVSGTVTAVNVAAGDSVGANTAAIELTDVSTLWLTAPLNELDLGQVSEGMTASVSLDAVPDEAVTGTLERIAWIGVENNGIVEFDVWLSLDLDDQSAVRPGMTGEATITLS